MIGAVNCIYLASIPIDMRKSIDGLSMLVSSEFGQNPCSGSWYVFYNRGRYMTLDSKEQFSAISLIELQVLLAGVDIKTLKMPRILEYSVF
ncbi:MAG: IS66 family insertion sequence element accessory protein TnpB [Gammaproteobacteria bacterium]|nr:IS66 family insertion sequence element accessory protein TnpB [Gammaproteobacteria bacterium]